MAKMINDVQRSKIFAIARELDMSTRSREKDDDLHLLIDGLVEKSSITLLTFDEAEKVIAELQHRQRFGAAKAPPKAKKKASKKSVHVSENLQNKIWAMMYELQKYDKVPSTASLGDRLSGIISKTLRIDATAKDPFIWLNNNDANYLIDKVLKNYIASAKKKAGADAVRSGVG